MKARVRGTTVVWGIGMVLLMSGCAAQYEKTEKQVESMPINCATAEGDLRMLRSEKANTLKEIAAGVSTIAPIGLVAGVATGTEGAKAKVATGEYNRMLDQKIAEIQQACGVQ